MNREIKFRGFDPDKKEWVYGAYYSVVGLAVLSGAEWDNERKVMVDRPVSVDVHCIVKSTLPDTNGWLISGTTSVTTVVKETVGQFTGLKDKHGVEIYEGDILMPTKYTKATTWHDFKCVVIEYNGMFCFQPNGGLIQSHRPLFESLNSAVFASNPYEIIGNIHSNPELLTK